MAMAVIVVLGSPALTTKIRTWTSVFPCFPFTETTMIRPGWAQLLSHNY